MTVLREKLGGGFADHSIGQRVVSRAHFLGSSRVHPTLMMACERLPHTCTAHKKCMYGVHGLTREVYMLCISGFSIQGINRFELS
jgi:hypothetical protein